MRWRRRARAGRCRDRGRSARPHRSARARSPCCRRSGSSAPPNMGTSREPRRRSRPPEHSIGVGSPMAGESPCPCACTRAELEESEDDNGTPALGPLRDPLRCRLPQGEAVDRRPRTPTQATSVTPTGPSTGSSSAATAWSRSTAWIERSIPGSAIDVPVGTAHRIGQQGSRAARCSSRSSTGPASARTTSSASTTTTAGPADPTTAATARRVRRTMKFNHIGIPTTESFDGEIPLPHLKVSGQRPPGQPVRDPVAALLGRRAVPEIVKTVPHVAFEVDDLDEASRGHRVIIEPNSPSPGVMVAFIEVRGARSNSSRSDHRAETGPLAGPIS